MKPLSLPLATYSKETINEVLRAADIVEVVSRAVELKPSSGGRFLALCPFHHEKTPSFTVSRDRQTYHCFGCGKGGDAISFLCEFDGLSFVEALQRLADDAGIRLPAMTSRESGQDQRRGRLLDVNAFAAQFYTDALHDPLKGGKGRRYLNGRNFKDETIKRFGLGYAAEGWSGLTDAARLKGFDERLLEASGLVRRSDKGSCYDFFRDRLMVPIRDTSGRVVAFGGRDLSGDSPAKYINTPENELYKKSRVLFGLYEARDAMRREQRAVLVEGYFDLLRPFEVGIENVVATCGTALTAEQAQLLHRYVPEVIIVYDGDAAGIQAAIRGVSILTAAGISVRALTLPAGQDPDDFIQSDGAQAFTERIASAPDFVTFYVEMSRERLGTIEGRTAIARELFGILANLDDELRREEYLKRMAQVLNLNEWSVRSEYQKAARQTARRAARQEQANPPSYKVTLDDLDFLAVVMTVESMRAKVEQSIEGFELPDTPFGQVLAEVIHGATPETLYALNDEAARQLYTAATSQTPPNGERAEIIVDKRLVRLERDALKQEEATLKEAIFKAQEANDEDRLMELLDRQLSIAKRREKLGAA